MIPLLLRKSKERKRKPQSDSIQHIDGQNRNQQLQSTLKLSLRRFSDMFSFTSRRSSKQSTSTEESNLLSASIPELLIQDDVQNEGQVDFDQTRAIDAQVLLKAAQVEAVNGPEPVDSEVAMGTSEALKNSTLMEQTNGSHAEEICDDVIDVEQIQLDLTQIIERPETTGCAGCKFELKETESVPQVEVCDSLAVKLNTSQDSIEDDARNRSKKFMLALINNVEFAYDNKSEELCEEQQRPVSADAEKFLNALKSNVTFKFDQSNTGNMSEHPTSHCGDLTMEYGSVGIYSNDNAETDIEIPVGNDVDWTPFESSLENEYPYTGYPPYSGMSITDYFELATNGGIDEAISAPGTSENYGDWTAFESSLGQQYCNTMSVADYFAQLDQEFQNYNYACTTDVLPEYPNEIQEKTIAGSVEDPIAYLKQYVSDPLVYNQDKSHILLDLHDLTAKGRLESIEGHRVVGTQSESNAVFYNDKFSKPNAFEPFVRCQSDSQILFDRRDLSSKGMPESIDVHGVASPESESNVAFNTDVIDCRKSPVCLTEVEAENVDLIEVVKDQAVQLKENVQQDVFNNFTSKVKARWAPMGKKMCGSWLKMETTVTETALIACDQSWKSTFFKRRNELILPLDLCSIKFKPGKSHKLQIVSAKTPISKSTHKIGRCVGFQMELKFREPQSAKEFYTVVSKRIAHNFEHNICGSQAVGGETGTELLARFHKLFQMCTMAGCTNRNPTWACLNTFKLICCDCAGKARGIDGAKVRSVLMDNRCWEPAVLAKFFSRESE